MSDINLKWLYDHFKNRASLTIFDIGANQCGDSVRFKRTFPFAEVHSFECSNLLYDNNIKLAQEFDLIYNHVAVDASDGTALFYPSLYRNDLPWMDSGTLQQTNLKLEQLQDLTFGEPYEVKTLCINTYCKKIDAVPNFIHIDAEGKEPDILESIYDEYLPDLIWSERPLGHKKDVLDNILEKKQYCVKYRDTHDILYAKNGYHVEDYVPFLYEYGVTPDFDREILLNLWIQDYNTIKDPSWPEITSVEDFDNLPDDIKTECETVHNFTFYNEFNKRKA